MTVLANTPSDILATALAPYKDDREAFLGLALLAHVHGRVIRRAMNGAKSHGTDADAYLRLCAAVGIDPVDGRPDTSHAPGPLDRKLFSIGVRIIRYQRNQTMREAAKEMGLSVTTLCFIENGQVRSIESMLAACRYVGVHPCLYVTRETTQKTNKQIQSVAA